MRSWQSRLAIGKGRPLLRGPSCQTPIRNRQFHDTRVLKAGDSPPPEGVEYSGMLDSLLFASELLAKKIVQLVTLVNLTN